MFFGRNNDIDDDNTFETKNNDKKKINVKLPLIILGSVILLIVAIFLINKLMNKEEIAYEERLYYINLLGDKEVTLYVGDEYIEPGYTGTDDTGNDLTNEVVTSNNIENDKVGNYKLSYTLGNITKERIVKVIEKPVGATYIYLYGDVNTFLYIGDTYQEKGYEVIDTLEGSKLKDKVVITSNVDTSKEGIYKVIYSVVNSSGVTVSKERTVIVTSRDISLLPNNTNITNGNVTINIYVKDELFDYLILPDNKKLTDKIWAYEVSNNGTYTFTMYNTKGEKSEKKVIINNIDRESPSGSCTGSSGNGISQINIKANDNIGISKYVLNGTTYTTNSIRLNEELRSVNVTIYDKAGNSKNISCNLENKNPPSQSNKHTKVLLNVKAGTSKKNFEGMDYYEVIPEGATINMPLIIYFIGGSPKDAFANPEQDIFNELPMTAITNGTAYKYSKFIFIMPSYFPYYKDSFIQVKELIDYVVSKYKCNKNKIIITGHSNGGAAVYSMVSNDPNFFSAAVPMSAPATANAKKFVNTKFWSFCGTAGIDANYAVSISKFVNDINTIDSTANAHLTTTNNDFIDKIYRDLGKEVTSTTQYSKFDHSSIQDFYNREELWEWMLRQ